MTAYNNMTAKLAGLKQGLDSRVESRPAVAQIVYGVAVMGRLGDNKVDAYRLDGKLVFDADFVASNSIVITVNGTAVTAVVFDTDQATTMTALKAQIEADIAGASVALTDVAGDNRTLVVSIPGSDVVLTEAVTGGDSQATGTATQENNQVFVGVSLRTQKEYNGENYYSVNEAVNIMKEGWITVEAAEAVNENGVVYIKTSGADKGKFGASGTEVVGAKFRETLGAAGLVDIILI